MTSPLLAPPPPLGYCNVERQRPTKTGSCEEKHHAHVCLERFQVSCELYCTAGKVRVDAEIVVATTSVDR